MSTFGLGGFMGDHLCDRYLAAAKLAARRGRRDWIHLVIQIIAIYTHTHLYTSGTSVQIIKWMILRLEVQHCIKLMVIGRILMTVVHSACTCRNLKI